MAVTKRNRGIANVRTTTTINRKVPPFIQLVVTQYEGSSGLASRLAALDADGVVWQYTHAEKGWVMVPTDRIYPI